VPPPGGPYSFGTTNDGGIRDGVPLPDRGEGFVRARPGEVTRFGTPTLVAALERAAAEVMHHFPGSAPLRVGDLASPGGGRHPRHGSHRSGRDVDVLFYMTDPSGRSREGRGWLAYNRFGFAVEGERPDGGPRGALFLFDAERNWHFVRTLLLDEEAAVQWLFVSRGVKARLLRYAIDHEPDPRVLARAAFVLHQPAHAAPHDDHFHVRVLCTPRELAHGCRQRGPIWPWLRAEREKPEVVAGDTLDDAALVNELLTPPIALEPAPSDNGS
jgi:penicillin-insensitive murein endopeptidase